MGFETEFNWVLKLSLEKKDLENLVDGKTIGFEKSEERVYPVDMNIFLVDLDWNALGYVKVERCMYEKGRTVGEYKLGRLFGEEEKENYTELLKEMYQK